MWLALQVRRHPTLDVYATENGYLLYGDGELVAEYDTDKNYRRTLIGGKIYSVHILIAESWHENCDNLPVVNHIDGDKKNCRPDNLEWATYSDNLNHAYATGLRTDNNITYVRDIRTGDVSQYVSQAKAARSVGASAPALCAYLKSTREAPFMRYYEIRYDEEWQLTMDDTTKYRKSDRKRVVVVLESGEIVVYPQIPAFLNAMVPDIKYATAYQRLVNGTFKKYTGINAVLEFEYVGSLDGATYIEDKTKATIVRPTRLPKRIKVVFVQKEETVVREYDSLKEFCEEHSFRLVAVQRAVWKKGVYRIYHITYLG